MIIKKGQVITFDIKYGGEPEPEVKWIKIDEVCIICFVIMGRNYIFVTTFSTTLYSFDSMDFSMGIICRYILDPPKVVYP